MTYAAITGWGKCMPPAVLSNADLATFVDTTDEWIMQRTGIHERRVSHVTGVTLSAVAAARALACAGIRATDVELIVYGSCSNEEQIPNTASGLSVKLGAGHAAAMDVNTACTSFLYGLSTATAMIRTGVVKTALVVGVEVISPFLDWRNRNVAVLFGDGAAAVVLQATDEPVGVLAEKLGCYADARQVLRVRGAGFTYAMDGNVTFGDTIWDFDGQEIFKRAISGMTESAAAALARCGKSAADIDLAVPHQANLRIIEFVARKTGVPMDRVFVTVHKYGNMSSATVPVALVEALEAGRVHPGSLLLTPAFGGGLTYCSHVIRWGERVTPVDASDAQLPPCECSALDLARDYMGRHDSRRSAAGLMAPVFPDATPHAPS
jgi:3-oxoacyl-[acyl-carrier-protein] synthase III